MGYIKGRFPAVVEAAALQRDRRRCGEAFNHSTERHTVFNIQQSQNPL